MEQRTKEKLLLFISAIFGLAALVLILISLFGDFETNELLVVGIGCVVLGNLFNLMRIRNNNQ